MVFVVGCSDDAKDPAEDGGVDLAQKLDQKGAPDSAQKSDGAGKPDGTATPDKTVTVDSKVGSDRGVPKVLASTHKGWKATKCSDSTCHGTLPVKKHTETNESSCASCHGGNGACDPTKSTKSHTKSMTCVGGCHGSRKHTFTKDSDCISCHFAATGLDAC